MREGGHGGGGTCSLSDFFCRRIIMVYAQLQKYVKVGGKL